MKTAIYVRVSSEEQVKEGYSIAAQLRSLKAFCVSQDWEPTGIYVDEGLSAKDMERPELQRMLDDVRAKKIECVLIYRLDRLTRSVHDLYKILETLEEHGCKFKSATEVYDTTTAMGRMFITIVAALAQWERENMGERISVGFEEKARQGKYPHNFAPYGYELNKEESRLYIKRDEARVVRMIYDLYLNGYGNATTARELNKKGILTRNGNRWSEKSIYIILRNPVYHGRYKWKDVIYESDHEPIVTKEDWKEVARIRATRRHTPGRSVSSDYVFSRKLRCNTCGGAMTGAYSTAVLLGDKRVKYFNYRCRNHTNGYCDRPCNVSETRLEKSFLEYISKIDMSEHIDEVSKHMEDDLEVSEQEEEIMQLEKELEAIEDRKKKWQYAWMDDILSYSDFKKRMAEERSKEVIIQEELESLVVVEEDEKIDLELVKEILSDVKHNWESLTRQEKKSLVDSLVDRIHYVQEGVYVTVTGLDYKN